MSAQYRQGDILVVAVDSIPANAVNVPRTGEEVVLADDEATGHRLAITDGHADLLSAPGEQIDQLFLRITGAAAVLDHPEHEPITLPVGSYRVIRPREYTPTTTHDVPD
jgi:hypothetical protein